MQINIYIYIQNLKKRSIFQDRELLEEAVLSARERAKSRILRLTAVW